MVAPTQVVILPIIPKEKDRDSVMTAVHQLADQLNNVKYAGLPLRL